MGVITEQWKNPAYVVADSTVPNLKKVGGGTSWNAGAISRLLVKELSECGMRFTARELNTNRMCGLANNIDSNQSYTDIELAWYLYSAPLLQIYESGTLVYNPSPIVPYSEGDLLEIQIEYTAENIGFNDNFNDNSIDGSKWTAVNPPTDGTIQEINNRLELKYPAATGYGNIRSQNIDFRNRELIVDVVSASGKFYSYHENYFQIIEGSGKSCFLYFGGGSGLARIYDNGTYYQVSFTTDVIRFRFRHNESTGVLYLDYQTSNGVWNNALTRILTDFSLANVYIQIDAGQYANSGQAGEFIIDNLKVIDAYSGWSARYYHTPFGGSRILRYVSQRDVTTLFPLRIDTSFEHENATIENVEYLGANWVDEKGISKFPSALTPKQQNWKKLMNPYFGGGSGGPVVPPVTQGQIYPRGIKS